MMIGTVLMGKIAIKTFYQYQIKLHRGHDISVEKIEEYCRKENLLKITEEQ